MLNVLVRTADGAPEEVAFESTTFNIMDGALVVYDLTGKYVIAGIAAGEWLSFEVVDNGRP